MKSFSFSSVAVELSDFAALLCIAGCHLVQNGGLMKQDYYADLGVAKNATQAEIKTAYRKLVIEHHPDKQGDPIKFRAVAEAYDVIGDPVKREAYDFAQNNARVVDLKGESTALVEEYFRQFKPQTL